MDETANSIRPLCPSFENLTKTFPESFGAKDIPLMLVSILLSGISVIPNYKFGGAFGVEFAKEINDHLTPEQLEIVKQFSAIMSAVINGYINARSVNNAVLELMHQGEKICIPGHRVKAFFGLLGMLSLSGIAAIPNIQFVEDTLKDWGGVEKLTMKVVIMIINTALNMRGVSGLVSVAQAAPCFGQKNRDDAAKIRKQILIALRAKLSLHNQINKDLDLEDADGVDGLTLLSEGTLYRDKYPLLRGAVSTVAMVAPLAYSFGAYFYSAEKAMEKLERTDELDYGTLVYYIAMGGAYTVSTISFLVKWAFLSRVNYNLVQRFFNRYLSDPIIPQEDKIKIHPVLQAAYEVLNIASSATSLTGGFGMVDVYLFLGEKSLGASLGAISITLAAAIAINYIDPIDINSGVAETLRRGLICLLKDLTSINKDKFGETKDHFLLKCMLYFALTPDSTILSRYGQNIGQETSVLLDGPSNSTPAPSALEELLAEIDQISDKTYEQFLENHGEQAVKKENTNLSTFISRPASENPSPESVRAKKTNVDPESSDSSNSCVLF